jgi:ketosteroid isomerase-like protein
MAIQLAADEAGIRQRIGNLAQAIRAMNLEGVKPIYAPDTVSFDFVPPLQHLRAAAKWHNWADVFTAYLRPLGYEIRDLTLTVTDDLAFGYSLDPGTGRLTGEAGVQYALRIRNACLVAAAFADAGITAIVTDTIIGEGFESLNEVLGGRPVNFVVLRPPVEVLRQRGVDRLPEEAAYLADRYGDSDHPEAAEFASRLQAAADGRPVNEFEEIIERGLDRLPHVGLWIDPSGFDPKSVVDLLLDRRTEAVWMVDAADVPQRSQEALTKIHTASGLAGPAEGRGFGPDPCQINYATTISGLPGHRDLCLRPAEEVKHPPGEQCGGVRVVRRQ